MTKEESDLIITEQNKSTEEILKAVAKVKADYHELCNLKDMRIAELEAQIEKMKNRKVFLLQRVDSYDNSIDKQFYTTDEELAKEWDDYYKRNYWYGEAIELEEFSDKERVREELEND